MNVRRQAIVAAATGAFLSYVVVDFLTHAVVLAQWWRATKTFWLPPLELFRRIPFGYGALLIYCASLTVLLTLLHGERPRLSTGARLGAIAGAIFGVVSALGTYSVFRAPPSLLVVFPVIATVASTAAGAAAAWILNGERRWRRVGLLVVLALILFVIGVVAQNLLSARTSIW